MPAETRKTHHDKTYPVMNGNEPSILQPSVNGWQMSWNPDDGRWYVEYPNANGVAIATFKERRNAIRYARINHPV